MLSLTLSLAVLSSTPNTFCSRIKVREKLNVPTYAFYTHNPRLDKDKRGTLLRERGEFGTPFLYISPIDLISKIPRRRKSFVESELEIKANTCNNIMDSQAQSLVDSEHLNDLYCFEKSRSVGRTNIILSV